MLSWKKSTLKSIIFICLLTIFLHDFSLHNITKLQICCKVTLRLICTELLFGWLHYWLIINFIVYPTFTMWQRTINKMQKTNVIRFLDDCLFLYKLNIFLSNYTKLLILQWWNTLVSYTVGNFLYIFLST
jgi:hypothetical protein